MSRIKVNAISSFPSRKKKKKKQVTQICSIYDAQSMN